MPASLQTLLRLATLRWLGVFVCALATLLATTSTASALEPAQTKTRVWGFDFAEHNSVGLFRAASSGKHQGNRLARAEEASGSLLAAEGGALRGINQFGGVVSSSENAAGGVVVTAEGSVQGVDFAGHVNAGLMRGEPVNILSGVHGTEAGVMSADAAILGEDAAMFGHIEGVTVHNTANLSGAQISGMLNGPGTTIGAFCNSGICLAPFR